MSSSLGFGKHKIVLHLILFSTILIMVNCGDGINYVSRQGLMKSSVFPSEIDAVVGEEIYLKIIKPVADQKHCYYRKTGGTDIDIKTPHKQNFEEWNQETCGLRIKNISIEEHGFWRLTSTNDNANVARGIVFINVRSEIVEQPARKDIHSLDVDISPEETAYCYVLRPDQSKSVFPQHEICEFPKFNHESEGNGMWNVVTGIKGRTQEVSFEVNVQTIVEQLQTSVEHNGNELNMKCKLVNSKKMIKFCRFLRLIDELGFHLEMGRGDQRYSYFGNGFENGECGISIVNADENDKSPWKCFIGVDEDGELKTVGAVVDGTDPTQKTTRGEIETNDVYGLEDTPVNLLCRRYIRTDYCWFRDPSGQKISVFDQTDSKSNDMYSYFGTGIKLGECGITILRAAHNHSGTWSCHMGATDVAGIDTVKEISVRITDSPLVSTNLLQDAQHGNSLLLECRSIPEHVPLDYCRFVQPDGIGFSINDKTKSNNPLMNNYYFNPNRQMKSGYCSIIVKKVDHSHQGQWLCAGRLTGSDKESSDEFRVSVFEQTEQATASITGMAFAFIFVIGGIIFISYRAYRQKYALRRNTRNTVVTYVTNNDNVSISSNHSLSNDSQNDGIEIRTVN